MLPSLAAALLLAQAPAALSAPQPMPTGDALEKRIVANDARLFWGFFEGCDPDAVSDLIHPDFRMLHDLVGMPLSSGAQMNCSPSMYIPDEPRAPTTTYPRGQSSS